MRNTIWYFIFFFTSASLPQWPAVAQCLDHPYLEDCCDFDTMLWWYQSNASSGMPHGPHGREWGHNASSRQLDNCLPFTAKARSLGLSWHCLSDILGYKVRTVDGFSLTLQQMYYVLATHFDLLGIMIPFTTWVKMLIPQLWAKKRDWDDPISLQTSWRNGTNKRRSY